MVRTVTDRYFWHRALPHQRRGDGRHLWQGSTGRTLAALSADCIPIRKSIYVRHVDFPGC